MPYAAPMVGDASRSRRAPARASGRRGGTSSPVTWSTTVSWIPPTALATTGRPQAIASSGTIPNGSYQGTHATASAERSSAGTSERATAPSSRTRSATPAAQPEGFGVAVHRRLARRPRRTARDQQLDPRQPAQRRDHLVDALTPD